MALSTVVQHTPSGDCLAETLADIARILADADPVRRNLWITYRYYELSRGVAGVVDDRNVNWSTFATWASKTVGRSIRSEDLERWLGRTLGVERLLMAELSAWSRGVLRWTGLDRLVPRAMVAALREYSVEAAEGNRKVFEELAPVFARFIDGFRRDPTGGELEGLIESLREGDTAAGGQELLRRAFRNYAAARSEPDPRRRAELILLGSCQIGLHEQTRLQPHIQGAIDAPLAATFKKHLRRELPALIRWPLASVVSLWLRDFVRVVQGAWQVTVTRLFMHLALPGAEEMPLDSDVPLLPAGYPADLAQPELPELIELLGRFDLDLSSAVGSAAANWVDLHERMGFIVELFRARQQQIELLAPPFTEGQLRELEAGRIPSGEL